MANTHLPCIDCGSSDGLTMYDDHSYCFVCKKWKPIKGDKVEMATPLYTEIEYTDIRSRGLTEETCKKYGYGIGKDDYGNTIQIAPYYSDTKELLFQKTRDKDKNFRIKGTKAYRFFGQHLFQTGGRKLVITEGEIDCLTTSQVQDNKYPVVSVPFGAGSVFKTFKENYDWLLSFEEIILMLDMDKAGREAVETVGSLLPPNRLKIATLPLKDPNECLVNGIPQEIIKAIWNAREFRPDGILNAKDLKDVLFTDTEELDSIPYPPFAPKLTHMTNGLRRGEMVLLTAGTGIGKSTLARELAYYLKTQQKCKIGLVMLEENPKKTLRDLLSIHLERPLHLEWNNKNKLKEIKEKHFDSLFGDGNFIVYDHFGSISSSNLLDKIRFLLTCEDCDFVIFDHISIAVSGLDGTKDERKTIDHLMTHLRALIEETKKGIIVISHLRKVETSSIPFESGGKINLDDLRGSGSLKQLPDTIIALERNQQAEQETDKNKLKIRVLKNRFLGNTGLADTIEFNKKTNRLVLVDDLEIPQKEEEDICQF